MIQLMPSQERYVARLAAGDSEDDICRKFAVKITSLRNTLNQARRKVGVKTNAQLVAAFHLNKLTRSK